MLGILWLDWLALALYFVVISLVGVWTARRIHNTEDFFMGGRRFNRWFMMFFSFGTGTSGNDAVGVASKTYTSGMSGIWYQWLWLFATPFYWLIAPIFRRMRALTTGDYFEQRYDTSVAGLYSLVGVVQAVFKIGMLLLGGSMMVQAISGGAISYRAAIIFMTLIFLAYGLAGGLIAAVVTDLLQGVLTIIMSFMLLPSALIAVGGMSGLREKIQDPDMFSLVSPGEIDSFHILMSASVALIGIVTQPPIMGVCAAGRSEMDGRFGFASGNLLKRICTIPWMLVGLCGIALYPALSTSTPGNSPDMVYGLVARDLLPLLAPGLIGIFLASLLASIMSTCDALMVSSAGLLTQNLYRRLWRREASEGHYVLVGRIASAVIVMASLLIAFSLEDVPTALEMFFMIQAAMGAAFWLGLFWRRTTVAGAWAGTLAGAAMMIFTWYPSMQPWFADNLPELMIWENKLRYSWSVCLYLSAGFLATVVVSLLTPRVQEARLNQLYDCLRTPVVGKEPHLAPFTLPPGVTPGPPNKLIDHPDLEIPKPSVVGMAGFAVFAACVVGLILFVYWVASLGA